MSATPHDLAPWVLTSVAALNSNSSWSGRVHIHKHLFILAELDLAKPPIEFVLYDYGPYSFELDEEIVELEMYGHLARSYPLPGYGPRYEPTAIGLKSAASLSGEDREAIVRVARELGDRSSQTLELIATCLWMERRKGESDEDRIVELVRAVKPRYEEEQIRGRLHETRELVLQLST